MLRKSFSWTARLSRWKGKLEEVFSKTCSTCCRTRCGVFHGTVNNYAAGLEKERIAVRSSVWVKHFLLFSPFTVYSSCNLHWWQGKAVLGFMALLHAHEYANQAMKLTGCRLFIQLRSAQAVPVISRPSHGLLPYDDNSFDYAMMATSQRFRKLLNLQSTLCPCRKNRASA